MKRTPRNPDPAKRWLAFLRNHKAIPAMDFFTVPTVTFNVLYCFFVIRHHAVAFCISASPHTLRVCGSSNSCGRRFHLSRLRGS